MSVVARWILARLDREQCDHHAADKTPLHLSFFERVRDLRDRLPQRHRVRVKRIDHDLAHGHLCL